MKDNPSETIAVILVIFCIGFITGMILMFHTSTYGKSELLKYEIIEYNKQGRVIWIQGTEAGKEINSRK